MEKQFITIEGARTHNLKNVSIKIPKNSLIVFTGVSGSGKTSLAFDTIYAESQRRYMESLSVYARRFMDIMPKPDFDDIKGISPSISVTQRSIQHNPRSTVGIMSEVYDYMRLLFARIGVLHSPATGLPIVVTPINLIVEQLINNYLDHRICIMFSHAAKSHKDIEELQKLGFQRIRSEKEIIDINEFETPTKKIDVIVDRLKVNEENKRRISDSLEIASQNGSGISRILDLDSEQILTFSNKYICPESGFSLKEIEPNLFSFNNPCGACKTCNGLGVIKKFSEDLIIPDKGLNVLTGAIKPWAKLEQNVIKRILSPLFEKYETSLFTAYKKLPEKLREKILHGEKEFEGVIPILEAQYKKTESIWRRAEISQYQITEMCNDCKGKRLNNDAMLVKIDGYTISDIASLSISKAQSFFADLEAKLSKKDIAIASKILREINSRLGFLNNIGLGYLTLDRPTPTLSGGESQRINLASQIGSGLSGVLYVLDEPSIGLHQRDNARLIETLKNLRDLGNTLLVVEHDKEIILESDHLVDVGQGAGIFGGEIMYNGSVSGISSEKRSLTGQYLNGTRCIPIPKHRREYKEENSVFLVGVKINNLKNLSVNFPLGCFSCVTGVSGCGKSSLVMETLYPALFCKINRHDLKGIDCVDIKGADQITRVINVDQSPIGRTPRSNPATYTDIFTIIRDFYTTLPEAKAKGYNAGRFSFNVEGGRCIACKGEGYIRVEMHFMSDVFVECDICKGQRFNEDTLDVKYKGKSIADVLALSVDEARDFFDTFPKLVKKLDFLKEVGLGYIKLGQAATTLSGGEAQRVKLAKELSRPEMERTIYILDEPTTGLHFEDINNLLKILHRLVDKGNTIVAIEHNMDFIKTADWIIDLGPEGGNAGGELVAAGTPEEVANCKTSLTGKYLKPYLHAQSK